MNRRWTDGAAWAGFCLAVAATTLLGAVGDSPGSPPATTPDTRPADNAACLTCHADLAHDHFSQSHDRTGTRCIHCHGPSATHAQNTGAAVRPDVRFGRVEVDPFCGQCHSPAHADPQRVARLIAESQRSANPARPLDVCTDCHSHDRARATASRPASGMTESRRPDINLFNGKDLTGWVAEGNAHWRVENGMLVGTQGPDYAPGDLFTQASYADFDLTVTYRITWPANSGVWFRYQSPSLAYQADILEYPKPVAYSGTIYCPGRLFLAINDDPDLVNRDGWNTLRIRAVADHLAVWLNGFPVGEVRDAASRTGRIGFQIHPGKEFAPMKIVVRRIRLQPVSVHPEK